MGALIYMKGVCKSFTGNKVLSGVDLEVREGEVHALLGENGAGKSTLIKILGGIYSMDEGEIGINDKKAAIQSISDARKNGISIIHQELMLAPHMSIAENVYMGNECFKIKGIVDLRQQEKETQKKLDMFNLNLKANTLINKLTIAQQQMVEIIRAISFEAKVIVMDEPTSSLSEKEVVILFNMIRKLKAQKVGIIYISHRLNELDEISDRITVLRDGKNVGTVLTKEVERSKLIAMMVGRELSSYYTKTETATDQVILEVNGLSDGNKVKDVSFNLRKGEVLGISGLVGAGRSEAIKCLFGLTTYKKGIIKLNGKEIKFKNPREAMNAGIGFVPENRKEEGLFLEQSVRFNSTITILNHFIKRFIYKQNEEKNAVIENIEKMQIKVTSMEQRIGELSGGNQQKVIFGRWLNSTNNILILDEPTKGVDIKTKMEIYFLINRLAKNGLSIILISSELPELINLSDRVVVLCNGRSTGILNRAELSQESIMTLATKEFVS